MIVGVLSCVCKLILLGREAFYGEPKPTLLEKWRHAPAYDILAELLSGIGEGLI